MPMFEIEVKFKVANREVSWEKFASTFLAEAFRLVHNEAQPVSGVLQAPAVSARSTGEEKSQGPRAVGIDEAARLLSISPYTVRSHVARRKISSVRIGRRVLIPMRV